MRHRIHFDEDRGRVTITTEGKGDARGFIAAIEAAVNDPRWRPGLSILADHRKLSVADMPIDEVQDVALRFQKLRKILGRGRLANVMTTEVDFGMARSWEMMAEALIDLELHAFRDIDEARAWIETSPDIGASET